MDLTSRFAEMQYDRDTERHWREKLEMEALEYKNALIRLSHKAQHRLIEGIGDREFNADVESICHAVLRSKKGLQ